MIIKNKILYFDFFFLFFFTCIMVHFSSHSILFIFLHLIHNLRKAKKLFDFFKILFQSHIEFSTKTKVCN